MRFVDLQRQYRAYQTEIDTAIQKVLDSSSYILGPEVRELEACIEGYLGVPHAIAMSSGTDALLVALMAARVGSGDEVITTPFSFVAAVEMMALLGIRPVFVDICPGTYNIDPAQVESCITERTKAILPVSLYGQMPDWDRLQEIARKHQLPIIEDAAQSYGAIYQGGVRSGACSELAIASFFPAKPMGCYGDGGMLFVSDEKYLEAARAIYNHGQKSRYHHVEIGINGRMDTIQAAILLVKQAHFEEELVARTRIAQRYQDALGGLEGIRLPATAPYTERHTYSQYTIRTPHRERVIETLEQRGIPYAIHYPTPIHLQEAFRDLGWQKGDFPEAEAACQEVLSLPVHPFLTESEVAQVIEALQAAVKAI